MTHDPNSPQEPEIPRPDPPTRFVLDPSAPARAESGLFGLDSNRKDAGVVVLGVPWDATTSYRRGAALGPAAIVRASHQIDLYDLWTGRPYREGIAYVDGGTRVAKLNAQARALVDDVRHIRETSDNPFEHHDQSRRVDALGAEVNAIVHEHVAEALDAGRLPIVVGGDHSVTFGSLHAVAETCHGVGVLHFDAHADLRRAYEGFEWSHASVLYNASQRIPKLGNVVQVGVRDLCEEEAQAIEALPGVRAVFDRDWNRAKLERASVREYVREQLSHLPDDVYVTFDVDGLDPTLCPNTGTPVPGGLDWHEAMLWLEELVASGRRIVAADLVEVSPGATPKDEDSYDAIVGARLLYRLIGFAMQSGRR